MADPAGHVFNDKLYIYPSHDRETESAFDDDGGHFQMRDYHVLSFDDIEKGEATDHGVILDQDEVPWAEKQMWDNDVVEVDGRYYLIFSAKDYNGEFRLGVAVADRPEGPFIPEPHPMRGAYGIDPCMFKDEDGRIYCYWGGLWGGQLQWYRATSTRPILLSDKMPRQGGQSDLGHAPDMETEMYIENRHGALPSNVARWDFNTRQFMEASRPVMITDEDLRPMKAGDPHRFFEASWMHKYNGLYYFSYSTGDSHLICYAVGKSPYGPFNYKGVLLKPVVGWTTHHSIVEFKGKWYLLYHDCVPSGGITHLRSLKARRIEYDEDGMMFIV